MSSRSGSLELSQKKLALEFLYLVASGKVSEAFQKYIGPGFRHHNPFFRGDAESLRTAMEENAAKNPGKVLEIQRSLQDGDCVAVHSWVKQQPSDLGSALVHIFRFQGNLIVELWDIGQAIPKDSLNQYGMF